MRTAKRLALGCVLLAAAMAGAETPANPHVWKPDVRAVAVFKNGMGFFVRDGAVQLHDGWCVSSAVPPAVFGTLAIYSADDAHAVDLVGSGPGQIIEFERAGTSLDAAARAAQLRNLIDLQVRLSLHRDDETRTLDGEISDVAGEFALLKRADDLIAVPVADIQRVQVLDYPLRVHVAGDDPEGPARLGMACLQRGITWIPEYTLRVIDETTAELTLRATLINEVEDLVDADVHFVVGVPSFLHADYLSPLAVDQAIRAVAAALPVGVNSQMLSNAITQRAGRVQDQRANDHSPATDGNNTPADPLDGLPQIGGAGASDFTVYTRTGMTVRRGEKAVVTVFRRTVTYGHGYRWESPGALRHYLRIQNDTDTAWTTGPVVAVSGPRPLCEDLLAYTPRGSICELPVTTAINVATDVSESEVDRKLKAHEPSGNYFVDLVTIEGRLRVHNYENRAIELTIRRTVPGRLTTASDGGRITQDTARLKLLERTGWATWTLTLPPGAEHELTYRYERYVESR